MATFSALLALCSPLTGEFPSQGQVTRSFGAFFKRLSKQSFMLVIWDAITLIMTSLQCSWIFAKLERTNQAYLWLWSALLVQLHVNECLRASVLMACCRHLVSPVLQQGNAVSCTEMSIQVHWGAVVMQFNITWVCIHHYNDRIRTYIRVGVHKRRPIPHLYRQAKGCHKW